MKMTGSVRFRQLRAGAGLVIGDLVTSVSLSWIFTTKSKIMSQMFVSNIQLSVLFCEFLLYLEIVGHN